MPCLYSFVAAAERLPRYRNKSREQDISEDRHRLSPKCRCRVVSIHQDIDPTAGLVNE